ncbi:uncharacterized protein C3orf26 homolog [Littorina saxatilis]|uniref:Protein CMSS1 n=1 Tax=Littorina saxatilis TaxID=31220 RepID=A0AAN9BLJ8_9CAEN
MADDLDDEWWKAEDEKEVSSAKTDKKEKQGVKRPAPSDDSAGEESDEPSTPPDKATRPGTGDGIKSPEKGQKKSKKKKKNGRGKFVRRKITEEDEGSLKKAGTPEDVKKLLKPLVAVSATEDSESDEDSDEDTLSIESDFFPANEHLSSDGYLKEVLPGWSLVVKKAKLSPGSPLILILCSSAVRAVELNREIKSFLGKECKTAKLFAKHMKLDEQKTFLQKKVCHACIGTPNRVQALLEAGCLKLSSLHGIVLDWNWRDVKMKRMVDIPDVRRDLTLLLKEHALHKVKQTPCRIAIL